MPDIAMTIAAAIVIGGLIGSVGIGGVLLVPWLTGVVGMGVREAVAVAMASYIATGLVAILQAYCASGWKQVKSYWPLVVATLPGAFLGAMALALIPEKLALAILGVFLVLTGTWTLVKSRIMPAQPDGRHPPTWPLGLATGFASSLTGTGGPVVMIPTLLWCGVPLLTAVSLGQIVQLPIALAATSANAATGSLAIMSALIVSAGLVPGAFLGRWAALRLPLRAVSIAVAIMLVATGTALLVRAL